MKKIVLIILFTGLSVNAQVGINTTTPDASSILDISATDKGVLVPRVNLPNVTTSQLDGTNTAATGLLIWNTNATTVGGNGVGFYFFNGTQWMPITQAPTIDHDFYEVGTTSPPNSIADNIFKLGKLNLGTNSTSNFGSTLYVQDFNPSNNSGLSVARSLMSPNTSGRSRGINLALQGFSTDNYYGLENSLSGTFSSTSSNFYAINSASNSQDLLLYDGVFSSNAGNGRMFGYRSTFTSSITNTGSKYGFYTSIDDSLPGNHYGIYSNVSKSGSFAGYFLGNVSIGTTTGNNYILPASRGTNGQVMQTDGTGNVSWATPSVSTDDQNLVTPTLTGTTLNLGIENGIGTSIDLASLQDGTGTDDQTIDNFSLSGSTLRLSLENDGQPLQTVNLASINTDDQNLITPTLAGTTLNLNIENGTGTSIDLAPLQDGTGTDNQTIDNFSFNSTTNILTLEIEDDGIIPQTVNLSSLAGNDVDWYEQGTSNAPNAITDDIYTEGDVDINNGILSITTPTNSSGGLVVSKTISNAGSLTYSSVNNFVSLLGSNNSFMYNNVYTGNGTGSQTLLQNTFSSTGASFLTGMNNSFNNNNNSTQSYGIQNNFNITGFGSRVGFENNFSTVNGNATGLNNIITGGVGTLYGTRTQITGGTGTNYGNVVNMTGGTGTRYGFLADITGTGAGIEYGIRTNVEDITNGYAAYFQGRTSMGQGTTNRYLMPGTDGTAGQVMVTDGSGNLSFQNVSGGDVDWLEYPTNTNPDNINDNIYHLGRTAIGINDNTDGFNLYRLKIDTGTGDYGGLYIENDQGGAGINVVNSGSYTTGGVVQSISLRDESTGTRNKINLYNSLAGSGAGMTAQRNWFISFSNYDTEIGVRNDLWGGSNGTKYGTYNDVRGAGLGSKYGSYNIIETTAGGTHYGVYSEALKSNSYAGYFLGNVSIGTTTGNNYVFPATRGTNGQIMQTDAFGNLGWVTPSIGESTSASNGLTEVGNDIRLGGALIQPTVISQGVNSFDINLNSTGDFAIQDNGVDAFIVEDTGDVGIGLSNPNSKLDILETDNTDLIAVRITKTDNFTGSTYGLNINKTAAGTGRSHAIFNESSATGAGNNYAIYNLTDGTGTGQKYGVFNELNSTAIGSQYGTRNWVRGTTSAEQFGTFNNMENGSTGDQYGVYNGMRSTNASNMFGVYNEFLTANSSSSLMAGVRNRFTSGTPGANGFAGTFTDFAISANGTYYGTRNEYGTSSTGNGIKYGTFNKISASAGGTHYGTYNEVAASNGWAGYFVGRNYISDRLSIGELNNSNALLNISGISDGTVSHIELEQSSANTGARIRFKNATEISNEWVLFGRTDDTPADSRFNVFHSGGAGNIIVATGDGKVGINMTPSTNDLEVSGTASKATAGSWLANSDKRLKKNITTINPQEALKKIIRLRGVNYEWDDNSTNINRPKGYQMGFIAQEIAEIFPEKVTKDNLGYLQTAYGDYDPIVFQAIKALNDKIENLEKENTQLKLALEKINALEAKLEQMNIK